MRAWNEIRLKQICSKIQYGYTASATEEDTGVKFIRITDIVPDFINFTNVPYCKINDNELDKYLLKEGDIVIARTGATVGYAKCISQNIYKSVFASYLVRIQIIKEIHAKFIGLIVESNIYKNYVQTIAGGAAQPNANAQDLTSFKFLIPQFPTQQKIASILSTYDDLIENNNHRIAILEKMAANIYKEWFVRMRFPGYEKVKLIDGVPEGWKYQQLKEITSLIKRGITPIYDENVKGIVINQRCIRDGRVCLSESRNQSKKVPAEKLVKFGDILINSTGEGTLGRVAQSYFNINNLTVDSHVTIVRPSKINLGFLGMTLKRLQYLFESLAQGSTGQTELGREDIGSIKILIPNSNLIESYSEIYLKSQEEIEILLKKNDLLRQSRDKLLPKLIGGKLSVEHLVALEGENNNELGIVAEPYKDYLKSK